MPGGYSKETKYGITDVLTKMVMIDALKKPWNRMPVIHISSWKRPTGKGLEVGKVLSPLRPYVIKIHSSFISFLS